MNYTKYFLFIVSLISLSVYPTWQEITPGVKYRNLIFNNPNQSIHMLVVNPQQNIIKIGVAHDLCTSSEKTTDIAQRNNAIAAINAGFFDLGCRNKFIDWLVKGLDCFGYSAYNTYPMYSLKINNKYFSLSHNFTGALAWNNNDQQPIFSTIQAGITLKINDVAYPVIELNKPYPNGPALYSHEFAQKTPLHKQKSIEIIIVDNHIKKIYPNSSGNTEIPSNGWIYVLPKQYKNYLNSFHENDVVTITITHTHRDDFISHRNDIWDQKENILASTPLLVYNNEIVPYLHTFTSAFYTKKHPRSAVGFLKNGNWIFIVIDGRQKHSTGFTIMDLAHFMQKLGCKYALNLDGGGSSTMVIRNKIVNSPSGQEYSIVKKERPISNAFLICAK